MFPYIPATDDDIKYMLEKIGFSSVEDLFTDIPEDLKLKDGLKLDPAKSQLEVEAIVSRLANRNIDASKMPIFLGAGVYDHYIPAVVNHISSRAEFYTAYTPYQPEISQGTLQAIFEYQSMICELTDMDVANASLYDGASALAEAALMAVSVKKRPQVMASSLINPESLTILRTYLESQNIDLVLIPMDQGLTDADYIRDNISEQTAAVIIQSPNFIGYIEDLTQIEEYTHENASLLVMSVDPISLGILKTPGQLGADIAVGEGQSLGNPMNFGGPHLGFMACKNQFIRKMPGRIIGQTEDKEGRRGFVSTLQTREQHIRREKATSNICSNQALNALAASVYLATLGKKGIKEVAEQSWHKAHYAMREITKSGHYSIVYDRPFFKEFPIKSNIDADKIEKGLLESGIIGGYKLKNSLPNLTNAILYCVTEKRSRQEIDRLVTVLEGLR